MQFKYIDVHCHLQFPDYDTDREEIIAKMKDESIAGIVVGVDKDSSEKAVKLAEKHEHLFATVGLHPNYTKEEVLDVEALRELATHPKVVAVGECGLDYFRPEPNDVGAKERQEKAFRIQLSLAKELGKPVMVHARPRKGTQDVYDDVARILRECPGVVANIHFFVGDIETVSELGKCGVTFSYGGVVTFARDYDEAVRSIPSGSILTETDCPYAAPASRRGKRNDPLSIPEILKALSEVRCVEEDVLRQEVREAARRVFAIEAST